MNKPSIAIVSPALADSNNGNWQTARRWQQFLLPHYQVRVVKQWTGHGQDAHDQALIALHARRSADSIQAWAQARGLSSQGSPGLVVALTGTDIYRDIDNDASAQQSLQLASQLVVLQDQAPLRLPEPVRCKARVIYQSTTTRKTLSKPSTRFKVVMVGHLRDEKMPQTLMEAAVHLRSFHRVHMDHIGAPLDPELAQAAQDTMQVCSRYRWLGALPHEATRRRIQRAHVLVHCSQMEGGAHVIMEAVCSGTPVLASRMDGNVGMLGPQYPGYFEVGNAMALANLISQLDEDLRASATAPPAKPNLLTRLQLACKARALLFSPQLEQRQLLELMQHAIA